MLNRQIMGNGVSLGMDYCLDPDRWTKQGLLGEILEEIRSELKVHCKYQFSATPFTPVETERSNIMDIDSKPKSYIEQPDELIGLPVELDTSITSSSQMKLRT